VGKIVRLTEFELINLVRKSINEQSKGKTTVFPAATLTSSQPQQSSLQPTMNTQSVRYGEKTSVQKYEACVPSILKPFIIYVMTNKDSIIKKSGVDEKTFMQMVKASIGIIGRETKYGNYTETSDNVSEWLRSNGLGGLINLGIDATNKVRKTLGKNNITQSLGLAQFTPETWEQYGLSKLIGPYDKSFTSIGQGLGTMFKLNAEYKNALKAGLNPAVPSQNQILQKNGIINTINGTGNNALDAAIVTHNMTANKLLTKYCTTNNPLYAAPCNLSTYAPFDNEQSFNKNKSTKLINSAKVDQKYKNFPGTLTVNTNEVLPGYFPNLKGPNHTAIGYLEEVVGNMSTLNCF